MNASMDRPGRPRTPSRGLPAISATAAPRRSPLTNPARAQARALQPAELRAEHDRVRNALDSFPGHQARALEGLDGDAQRLRADLADAERDITQTTAELDGLTFLKRHGADGDELRHRLARDQDQRTYVERRYDDTLRQIAAHRGDNDPRRLGRPQRRAGSLPPRPPRRTYAPSTHEIEMVNAAFAAEPQQAHHSKDHA
jgi:hypothetical protein